MKSTTLGEFEELVLLIIAALRTEGYGNLIKKEILDRTGRRPSIGALHSALYRLEEKGFIESWWGDSSAKRGGRRKKHYKLSHTGIEALRKAHDLRNQLYHLIPEISTK